MVPFKHKINSTSLEFWFPLLLAAMVAAPGCRRAPQTAERGPEKPAAVQNDLPVLVTLPPFALRDESGQPFGTDQLAGKFWIANFIFTRCPTTCLLQTAQLKALRQRLELLPGGPDVQLISITVDPDHDTSEVLAAYSELAGAESENWHFLTGSRDEIWALCKTGFKLPVAEAPPEANSIILHSDRFMLVDRQGRIRGFFEGTTEEGSSAIYAGLQHMLSNP